MNYHWWWKWCFVSYVTFLLNEMLDWCSSMSLWIEATFFSSRIRSIFMLAHNSKFEEKQVSSSSSCVTVEYLREWGMCEGNARESILLCAKLAAPARETMTRTTLEALSFELLLALCLSLLLSLCPECPRKTMFEVPKFLLGSVCLRPHPAALEGDHSLGLTV